MSKNSWVYSSTSLGLLCNVNLHLLIDCIRFFLFEITHTIWGSVDSRSDLCDILSDSSFLHLCREIVLHCVWLYVDFGLILLSFIREEQIYLTLLHFHYPKTYSYIYVWFIFLGPELGRLWICRLNVFDTAFYYPLFPLILRSSMLRLKGISLLRWTVIALLSYTAPSKMMNTYTW